MAERSLFLWNNEYIVSLVAQHRHAVLPLVFPALERNARSHWNPAVHGLTVNVRPKRPGLGFSFKLEDPINATRAVSGSPPSTASLSTRHGDGFILWGEGRARHQGQV